MGRRDPTKNTLLLAKNAANILQDSDFATPNEHCTSLPGRHGCHVIPLTLQKLADPRPCKHGKMLSTWRKWNGKVRKYERICSWAFVATSREFESYGQPINSKYSTKSPICFLFHPEIAISCQQSHEERRVSLPTGPSPWLYFRKEFAIPHGKCWLNVIADFRPKDKILPDQIRPHLFSTLYRLLVCHSFKSAVKSLNATVS